MYPRDLIHAQKMLAAGALLAMLACGGASPPQAMTPPPGPPPTAAAPTPHDAARAEVARLTAEAAGDPILAPWTGPHGGSIPFDRIKVEGFAPAFTRGMALRTAEVAVIASNPEPPTFANTIAAYDDAGRHEERAEQLFAIWKENLNDPAIQKVAEEWSPKLAAARDAVFFNAPLFARIAAVYEGREAAGLTAEEKRLTELRHDRFVRAGARLGPEQQAQLGKINAEMASLFTEFSNKLLADEDTFIVIDKASDLAGLPESLKAAYKAAADERHLAGKWAVVNTRSSVDPFLAASSVRPLRERVWKAFKNRGDNGDAHDTNATIARIVKLRAERAALLGYPTHAHWRMADTMAVDPAKATELMMRVWPAAVARVKEEVADMQAIARKEGAKITIEPWDYLYYAEKVRKKKYDLDQDQLKPYFELDSMIRAAFFMAEQLYGLKLTEITGQVPVFHPDVRVWEVTGADGKYVGLFYGDYFARGSKRSGAWMSPYRVHETFRDAITPLTSNNNNFVRGAAGAPVLISLDDAETLFHEFGHAIHYLLSEVRYPGLSETPADFVEYPSQVHEMWVLTRPILDRFAHHYQTGKPMPQALVDKVTASSKFNQGYVTVEYLASAIVDMELHTVKGGVVDPDKLEREILTRIGAPREVAMRHRLPQFNHLFSSDDYSAGYYSYIWSEVMDADTREAFKEAGDVFDKATAEKMKKYILAPGNSTDRAEAYRQFRGRDPDVKALLQKRGFPTSAK